MTATLLAVDDSKTMRKVLDITFAGEDYKMVLADSPADAMAKLKTERPVIALVDAILGTSNGYDLCQQIKAEAPQVGVIVLSSKQHPYDRVKGGAAGADDYIDKPYDSQALIDKVAALANKLATAPVARPAAAHVPPTAHVPAAAVPARPAPAPAASPVAVRSTVAFGTPAPVASTPVKPAPAAQPLSTTAARSVPTHAITQQGVVAPPAHPAPPSVTTTPATTSATTATPVAAAVSATALIDASMESKLGALGLTKDQITSVLALSREVVEQVVWEVVPVLAETMIREEIRRVTAE